jgi:hypothetical protein
MWIVLRLVGSVGSIVQLDGPAGPVSTHFYEFRRVGSSVVVLVANWFLVAGTVVPVALVDDATMVVGNAVHERSPGGVLF